MPAFDILNVVKNLKTKQIIKFMLNLHKTLDFLEEYGYNIISTRKVRVLKFVFNLLGGNIK